MERYTAVGSGVLRQVNGSYAKSDWLAVGFPARSRFTTDLYYGRSTIEDWPLYIVAEYNVFVQLIYIVSQKPTLFRPRWFHDKNSSAPLVSRIDESRFDDGRYRYVMDFVMRAVTPGMVERNTVTALVLDLDFGASINQINVQWTLRSAKVANPSLSYASPAVYDNDLHANPWLNGTIVERDDEEVILSDGVEELPSLTPMPGLETGDYYFEFGFDGDSSVYSLTGARAVRLSSSKYGVPWRVSRDSVYTSSHSLFQSLGAEGIQGWLAIGADGVPYLSSTQVTVDLQQVGSRWSISRSSGAYLCWSNYPSAGAYNGFPNSYQLITSPTSSGATSFNAISAYS